MFYLISIINGGKITLNTVVMAKQAAG